MLVGIDGNYLPPPPPPPKPPPAPEIPAAPSGHAILTAEYSRLMPPMGPDRVSPSDTDGFQAHAKDWLKENWPAVGALAHGVVDAPGVVGREFRAAAESNEKLSKQLVKTMSGWSTDVPAVRDKNIAKLAELAKGKSEPIEKLAAELSAENTTPRLVHAVGVPAARAADKLGQTFKSAANKAIANMPSAVQGKLRSIASHIEHKASSVVDGVKAEVKAKIDHALPSELDARAKATVASLDRVAEQQSSAAKSTFRNGSRLIGYTPEDVAEWPSVAKAAPKVGSTLDHLSVLRDTPLLDVGLTGAGIYLDRGKGIADATVANVGSWVAGSQTQELATKLVTRVPRLTTTSYGEAAGGEAAGGEAVGEEAVGAVAAEGTETAAAAVGLDAALPEVAGAVAATGPVGVAVVGTVVVGAVVAYGVTKIVESQAGQNIIGGIAHLNGGQFDKGVDEAGSDVKHLASDAGHELHKLTSWL